MSSVYLEVDASELKHEMNRLASVMTPEKFNRIMGGIFRRTGGHVRMILRKDLPKEYNITGGPVGKAVKNARVTIGGTSSGCSIPVVDSRRHLGGGGRGYTAKGYRSGWKALTSGPYPISVHVYRGSWGTLPSHLPSYGGQPPFRNIPSRLGGLTFTREGRARLPIRPVMGDAIPQMPMNRSEPDVQNDIKDYMFKRMEHEFQRAIRG